MENASSPLVSIVTPVYNGEKYLEECIRSVIRQSYPNWEYLIADNCSSDQSLAIARRYAANDARIRILTNATTLPALANHNRMLQHISDASVYCKIVHADDWLFPECVEKMVVLAETSATIGIVGSYRLVAEKVKSVGLPYARSVINGREMARMNLLDGPYTFGSPSALLLRSALVRDHQPFYNESHPSADTEICYELLQSCDFGFVHQVLVFERIHAGSISASHHHLNKDIANLLLLFRKYGPIYLDDAEFKRVFQRRKKDYYRFLGSRILHVNDHDFWKFHRQALQRLGLSFSWSQFLYGSVRAAAHKMMAVRRLLG